jgi:putative oxidoreductase
MALASRLAEQASALTSAASLPHRLSLGSSMAFHGWSKLKPGAAGQMAGFYEQMGFRPGSRWVRALGLTELLAGVSALLGVGTRLAALGVLATQAVAISKVHAPKGFDVQKGGYEFNLALIGMALGLLLGGPGQASLAGALARARKPARRGLRLRAPRRRAPRLLALLG